MTGTVEQADEPSLVRRQLGHHLRRMRLAAGKTHADAETAGMGHRSTMWRIEAGRAKVRPATVRALCWLYHADDATTDALYAMACQAERPGAHYLEKPTELARYRGIFAALGSRSTPLEEFL